MLINIQAGVDQCMLMSITHDIPLCNFEGTVVLMSNVVCGRSKTAINYELLRAIPAM